MKRLGWKQFQAFFVPKQKFNINGINVMPLWNNIAMTSDLTLPKGSFKITTISCGTAFGGIYPHLDVYMSDLKIGDYYPKKDFQPRDFYFEQQLCGNVPLRIQMDNDTFNTITHEDRNAFIKAVCINKK